jgi:hypothetical protein
MIPGLESVVAMYTHVTIPERVNVVLGTYKHYPGSLSSLKTILHRRHFPLGGHVTTATRETTSNAGSALLFCGADRSLPYNKWDDLSEVKSEHQDMYTRCQIASVSDLELLLHALLVSSFIDKCASLTSTGCKGAIRFIHISLPMSIASASGEAADHPESHSHYKVIP